MLECEAGRRRWWVGSADSVSWQAPYLNGIIIIKQQINKNKNKTTKPNQTTLHFVHRPINSCYIEKEI